MIGKVARARTGLSLAIVVACGAAAIAADNRGGVAVRATPGLPDPVIDFIARVSEPQPTIIPANELPRDFIARRCGVYTTTYGKVFHGEVNKSVLADRSAEPRDVLLPACARWQNDFAVRVRAGETLDDILARRVGLTSNQRLVCQPGEPSRRCNKTMRQLIQEKYPGKNLDQLQEGEELVLPFATFLTTFHIKASAHLSAEQVVKKISELGRQDMSGGPIIKNFVAP